MKNILKSKTFIFSEVPETYIYYALKNCTGRKKRQYKIVLINSNTMKNINILQ